METKTKKILIIGFLTVVFWVASMCISSLVDDRSSLSNVTQEEVAESWSKEQTLVGPMLCVPVYRGTEQTPYTCMYVLPNEDKVDADVQSEILHRGIFDASVYRTKIAMSGNFDLSDMVLSKPASDNKKEQRYDWSHAQLMVAIGDKRGIEEGLKCQLGGQELELSQYFNRFGNTRLEPVFGYNCQEPVCRMVDLSQSVGKVVNFSMEASLKGSSELNIAPIGRNSQVTVHGNCADPSFVGMTLPSTREVTDEGFTATWKVNSLNRNDVDQVFYCESERKNFQTVGARLLVPGGQYTQTDRALKYAFLVILLSLMAVYVGDMSVRGDIGLFNYLLIGAALVLFYLMLLSFGEWVGFSMAYLISAVLILGMIMLYFRAIVRNGRTTLAVCLFMALVDIFVYVLLSLEEMALLVGSIGLFVVLGAAMFFSLRVSSDKKELKGNGETE